MDSLRTFWTGLTGAARVGLVAALVVVLGATLGAAAWLLRADKQVLFSDLRPEDAAAVVAELDRMKVPYRLGAEGHTIYVDGASVHATRLKLMNKDLPLRGTAGLELFNNADFGMTEFAQKINYQRALQGEIARTILSLSEVKDARVHLVLPEQGLFRRESATAKAAITITMKPGERLRPEQVTGIQRLVAAAVPGIAAQDVTIVDAQGVALTRAAGTQGEPAGTAMHLELKRETERHLARKATEVLERALGPGQALASVDVTLDLDQVKVTTEDVLPAPRSAGEPAAGVVVRERESAREWGAGGARTESLSGTTQRETEYQVGRRIEQVATQPGAIRRLQAVAVVRQPLDEAQLEQMRRLVAAAVGAVADRGDAVVVHSIQAVHAGASAAPAPTGVPAQDAIVAVTRAMPQAGGVDGRSSAEAAGVLAGAAVLIALGGAAAAVAVWRRRALPGPRRLKAAERERVLLQIQTWLEPSAAGPRAPLASEVQR